MKFELPQEHPSSPEEVNELADELIFQAQEMLEKELEDEEEHRSIVRALRDVRQRVADPVIRVGIDETLADIRERYGEI